MSPNAADIPVDKDVELDSTNKSQIQSTANLVNRPDDRNNYNLKIFQFSLNLLTHILIGAVTAICLFFSFRNGIPLNTTNLHIVLCVIGYQLLMAEAILALSPHNGWSANLRLVDKRRAHWILQVLGSGLAIAGSFIMILSKDIHWNTLHGQFALVALVFTVACFVNGLTSQYAYELRKFLPGNLSKITHICFGVVGFVAASISLCYGFDKGSFRNWAYIPALTTTVIVFTAVFITIIIINPIVIFFYKTVSTFRK